MENQGPANQNNENQIVVPKKSKKYFAAGAAAVLIIAAIFSFVHFSTKNAANEEPKKPEPSFHRDEPTEKQIFQRDYKQKIKEMLDSGNSVKDVSKQTKIRRDEVRKIKKEHDKEKDDLNQIH